MISIQAKAAEQSLSQVTDILRLEGAHTFSTQNEIQHATGCAFRDAQVAAKKILERLSISLSPDTSLVDDDLVKAELANLIIIEVTHLKKIMSKNFDLSEHQFLHLIGQLKQGDNVLFEKVFLAHFESCLHFVRKKFSISYDEAYDVTMDTLLLFRKKLVTDKVKYGNSRFLFTQMACQHYIKKNEKSRREIASANEASDDTEAVDEASIAILRQSWQELGVACQELLKKIYYGNMKLTEIAKEEQKSDVSIRKQKQRCVAKLRALFLKNKKKSQ